MHSDLIYLSSKKFSAFCFSLTISSNYLLYFFLLSAVGIDLGTTFSVVGVNVNGKVSDLVWSSAFKLTCSLLLPSSNHIVPAHLLLENYY